MNRYVVANLVCLAVVMGAAIAGTVALDWDWWAVLLVAAGAFLVGGLVVERTAPGTRLLDWLGWGESHSPPP